MAQAISNKVLVSGSQYCWMICDYTMSGSTLNYTLSFYYEGGCAQLDNAWIKVGNTIVWQNTGRVHNYTATAWNVPHTVGIASGTANISGSQTVSFGVTKYSGVGVSGSFNVSGASAPTGLTAEFISSTWNSVTAKASVTGWGGSSSAGLQFVVNSVASDYDHARQAYDVGSGMTGQLTATNSNITWKFDETFPLTGMRKWYLSGWAKNTANIIATYFDQTVRYLPPAPGNLSYTHTPDTTNYTLSYVGVPANNISNYDTGSYKKVIRYKTAASDWVTTEYTTGVGTASTKNIIIPFGATVTVEAWQEYHGEKSEVTTTTITNADSPARLYGSVSGQAKEIRKLYAPLNGQAKEIQKLYASVNGVAKLVYQAK